MSPVYDDFDRLCLRHDYFSYLLKVIDPKRVPVVIFSVSSNPADAERALELGAREFVQKPVGVEAYRHAVLKMIEMWALNSANKSMGA